MALKRANIAIFKKVAEIKQYELQNIAQLSMVAYMLSPELAVLRDFVIKTHLQTKDR